MKTPEKFHHLKKAISTLWLSNIVSDIQRLELIDKLKAEYKDVEI